MSLVCAFFGIFYSAAIVLLCLQPKGSKRRLNELKILKTRAEQGNRSKVKMLLSQMRICGRRLLDTPIQIQFKNLFIVISRDTRSFLKKRHKCIMVITRLQSDLAL